MKNNDLKGGKEDMEVQLTNRVKNLQKCPFCDEKPSGFGVNALIFNFQMHLEKHLRKNEISQEELENAMKRLRESIPPYIPENEKQ
ncbi:MAG: hypothetical protein NT055_02240 [Nitrospirae bacterium]|nr:hypothetical protein [Nitrospirota bacterium]